MHRHAEIPRGTHTANTSAIVRVSRLVSTPYWTARVMQGGRFQSHVPRGSLEPSSSCMTLGLRAMVVECISCVWRFECAGGGVVATRQRQQWRRSFGKVTTALPDTGLPGPHATWGTRGQSHKQPSVLQLTSGLSGKSVECVTPLMYPPHADCKMSQCTCILLPFARTHTHSQLAAACPSSLFLCFVNSTW